MTGKCPRCGKTVVVPSTRGSRVSDHACPGCGAPLHGVTKATGRGRYLCPIDGRLVTLGQRAVALNGPYQLVFQPGWEGLGTPRQRYRDQPNSIEQDRLDRVAGRVLGTGCVVCDYFDPHQHEAGGDPNAEEWVRTIHQKHRGRPGLRLAPAGGPGEPGGWIVNQPLTYRKCGGCTRKVPDLTCRCCTNGARGTPTPPATAVAGGVRPNRGRTPPGAWPATNATPEPATTHRSSDGLAR